VRERQQEAYDQQQAMIAKKINDIDALNKAKLIIDPNAILIPSPSNEIIAATEKLKTDNLTQSSIIPFDMDKILTWIKSNMILAAVLIIAAVAIFFPKVTRGIFGGSRTLHRRRVRKAITGSYTRRRRSRPMRSTKRRSGAKKPWQIKGSLAAKRHMAQIRRRR
jgi:hypothetical protein